MVRGSERIWCNADTVGNCLFSAMQDNMRLLSKVVLIYPMRIISTSLPIFGIINLFNFSHSVGSIVVRYCDFILHILYYYWLVWVQLGKRITQ